MRFADSIWLWGTGFALFLAVLHALGGLRLSQARKAFASEPRIAELLTARTALRRTAKAVLSCLAVALCFVAASKPQYGHGTRVLPATNLDVVLVLDYSKSMYARDVAPSRIERAKIEVARLVKKLGGARFGAVAFAGEPLSFPLSSDGAAIAQFFRGLEPRDMPVGGTAIGVALAAAQELFSRDPRSAHHEKVMILVTDGEDLEGDPIESARQAQKQGIRVEVVQIGGRSPEPIPEIDEHGTVVGMRKDEQGNIMTTSLSADGEAQLRAIAEAGRGKLHEAVQGEVGVDAIGDELRQLMSEELSERVETVYADVFHYPLGAAVVLLIIEGLIGGSKKQRRVVQPPRGKRKKRVPKRLQQTAVVLAVLGTWGCAPFDRLFERNSPIVDEAIAALAASQPSQASDLLTAYLETGRCEAGIIGAGDRARHYGDASLDLALALRGAAAPSKPSAAAPGGLALPPGVGTGQPNVGQANPTADSAKNPGELECALRLLGPLAENGEHSPALRARALYLMGNLEVSREEYRAAVSAYERGLLLAPGLPAGEGDEVGRWLAHNRAFALRRALEKEKEEQEKKDQKDDQKDQQDPSKDQQDKDDQKDQQDPSKDQQNKDDQKDQQDPSKDQQDKDDQKDQQDPSKDQQNKADPNKQDQGEPKTPEAQKDQKNDKATPNAASAKEGPSNPSATQDDRILDLLEQAPTLQQDQARKAAEVRARRGTRQTMEDK